MKTFSQFKSLESNSELPWYEKKPTRGQVQVFIEKYNLVPEAICEYNIFNNVKIWFIAENQHYFIINEQLIPIRVHYYTALFELSVSYTLDKSQYIIEIKPSLYWSKDVEVQITADDIEMKAVGNISHFRYLKAWHAVDIPGLMNSNQYVLHTWPVHGNVKMDELDVQNLDGKSVNVENQEEIYKWLNQKFEQHKRKLPLILPTDE